MFNAPMNAGSATSTPSRSRSCSHASCGQDLARARTATDRPGRGGTWDTGGGFRRLRRRHLRRPDQRRAVRLGLHRPPPDRPLRRQLRAGRRLRRPDVLRPQPRRLQPAQRLQLPDRSVLSVYDALTRSSAARRSSSGNPGEQAPSVQFRAQDRQARHRRPGPDRGPARLVEKVMRDLLSPYRRRTPTRSWTSSAQRRHGEDPPGLLPRRRTDRQRAAGASGGWKAPASCGTTACCRTCTCYVNIARYAAGVVDNVSARRSTFRAGSSCVERKRGQPSHRGRRLRVDRLLGEARSASCRSGRLLVERLLQQPGRVASRPAAGEGRAVP